ncbi:hypothetical protein CEXT_706851 [Caerostris extrusa]|uniref:Uncharacterized protein n=1 Tax=Caerostris extrusa TaxID=172846 RepID=A0AAV4PVX9_CAEEX|nr:hypothetical protein CEXT_706851 [Caerostris extrusa]
MRPVECSFPQLRGSSSTPGEGMSRRLCRFVDLRWRLEALNGLAIISFVKSPGWDAPVFGFRRVRCHHRSRN